MNGDSIIKDPALAPEGHRKIDWAAQHSPVLNAVFRNQLADGVLSGRKVAMTIHLEAKTAYLAVLLHEAGAEVTVSGSNPLSTQDDVGAAHAERGVRVYATHDPSDEDFEDYLLKTIETAPDRTSVSVISRACSPVSGWEISSSSRSTPSFFA